MRENRIAVVTTAIPGVTAMTKKALLRNVPMATPSNTSPGDALIPIKPDSSR